MHPKVLVAVFALLLAPIAAQAQTHPSPMTHTGHHAMSDGAMSDHTMSDHGMSDNAVSDQTMSDHGMSDHTMSDHAASDRAAALPTLPGQDAFGAIAEIVGILEADPQTDWSHVDIDALREHLIDMNELTLHAKARREPIEGGVRIEVTGAGRTGEAVRRMLLAHAPMIDGPNGWSAKAAPIANGAVLTVVSADPAQTARIRGLGFLGLMATGAHHQTHHLAIALGTFRP